MKWLRLGRVKKRRGAERRRRLRGKWEKGKKGEIKGSGLGW